MARKVLGTLQTFNYPPEFVTLPEYTAHAGQRVRVLRRLSDKEVDPENRPMFEVEAPDGWRGHAFGNELSPFNDQA